MKSSGKGDIFLTGIENMGHMVGLAAQEIDIDEKNLALKVLNFINGQLLLALFNDKECVLIFKDIENNILQGSHKSVKSIRSV